MKRGFIFLGELVEVLRESGLDAGSINLQKAIRHYGKATQLKRKRFSNTTQARRKVF
jgi:hypothetical protein